MKFSANTIAALLLLSMGASAQRRPPEIGRKLPDPGPNKIQVRFAIGPKTAVCDRFQLTAIEDGRVILAGKFASAIEIPSDAAALPRKDSLELEFKCGTYHWRFTKVPESAFRPGWWWVGTDYPPFQETFEGWPDFRDSLWIHYLIVDPQGFFVERHCPAKLLSKNPGPCYDEP